ncbi:hypothetical protein E4U54_004508 [Claviceps lovelessii]|nr:hypothetical protein E4U54_004508 [Claviceps lovelessii]
MNTPINGVDIPAALRSQAFTRALYSGLEAALIEQRQATPEFEHPDADRAPAYHLFAEQRRSHFKTREAERLRQLITDTEYWKHEVHCYAAAVDKVLDNAPKMEDWRNLARGYKSLLGWLGFSAQQVEQLRLSISIENHKYWRPEAEFFTLHSNILEYKILERLNKKIWRRQNRLAHRKLQAKQPSTQEVTQDSDQVSSRTRSKTCSGRVTKCR